MVANKVELPLKGGGGSSGGIYVRSDRNTQFGFFVSGRLGFDQWEDRLPQNKLWPNGNAANRRLFRRRFESWSGEHGLAAADDNRPARI